VLIALAIAVVVVGIVIAVVLVLRPKGKDLNSVQSYYTALGTLEHLSERVGAPPPPRVTPYRSRDPRVVAMSGVPGEEVPEHPRPVKIVPPSSASPADVAAGEPVLIFDDRTAGIVPPRPERQPATEAEAPRRFADDVVEAPGGDGAGDLFDDRAPIMVVGPGAGGPDVPVAPPTAVAEYPADPGPGFNPVLESGLNLPQLSRAERHAVQGIDSQVRRRRTALVMAFFVGVLVLVLVFSQSGHSSPNNATGANSTTTTVAHHGKKKPPTTTTVHATTPYAPVTSTSTSATYQVSAQSYTLTLSASGTCWVEAHNETAGTMLWAGELTAGSSQVLQATGTTTVQIGTPTVSFEVNSVPVTLPSPIYTPFVATFTQAPPPTPTTTTSLPSGNTGPVPTTSTVPSTTTTLPDPFAG
jgi:preprotein translocase subunit SecG